MTILDNIIEEYTGEEVNDINYIRIQSEIQSKLNNNLTEMGINANIVLDKHEFNSGKLHINIYFLKANLMNIFLNCAYYERSRQN